MKKRRHVKQTLTLEERLAEDTAQLREQARKMKPGVALDYIEMRIRQNECAAQFTEWLRSSPGPQPSER